MLLYDSVIILILVKGLHMPRRNIYKYHLKKGAKVVHRGITNDLERRQLEHQQKSLGVKIQQIGRRTTRKAALKWEREGGKRPYQK